MKLMTPTATIFLTPTEDVLLTSVTLPKMNQRRLFAAVTFALEDQLTDEITTLHFAIGTQDSTGKIPVAIIANEKMQRLSEEIAVLPQQRTHVYPDIFALPFIPQHWQIALLETRCLVRTGSETGFACEKTQLPLYLSAALRDAAALPECIHIHCFNHATADENQSILPHPLPVSINWIQHSSDEFADFAKSALKTLPSIDLLQGKWQPKDNRDSTATLWKLTTLCAVMFLLINPMYNLIAFYTLQTQVKKIDYAIEKIYRRHFPNATAIVAPRERLLAKLGRSSNNMIFLGLIAQMGNTLSQMPTIRLTQIDYRDNKLKMTVEGDTFDKLDTLINAIKHTGLKIKQQNAMTTDSHVRAEFLISSAKTHLEKQA